MYGISTILFLGVCIFSFLHIAKGNDCDHLGTIIYEDLSCKPIIQNGKNCPIKYECDLEEKNNTCLFRGREIPVNQEIPNDLIYGNCRIGCFCRGGLPSAEKLDKLIKGESVDVGGQFKCESLDCPEFFGQKPLERGCYRTYELNHCCAGGVLCDTPESHVGKCQISPDTTVLEGQQFYPPNTCMKCVCPKNFNGKFEEPHCERIKCAAQVRNQKDIIDHCAPFYTASEKDPLCCPSEWICPSENDKISTINPKADQSSDLRCKFGKTLLKLGEGFETKLTVWNKERKAKCECILPPFATCTEINN